MRAIQVRAPILCNLDYAHFAAFTRGEAVMEFPSAMLSRL